MPAGSRDRPPDDFHPPARTNRRDGIWHGRGYVTHCLAMQSWLSRLGLLGSHTCVGHAGNFGRKCQRCQWLLFHPGPARGTTLEKCEGPDSQENYQASSGRFPIVRETASQYRRTEVFLFVKDTPEPVSLDLPPRPQFSIGTRAKVGCRRIDIA
jgi:hypothetical protein